MLTPTSENIVQNGFYAVMRETLLLLTSYSIKDRCPWLAVTLHTSAERKTSRLVFEFSSWSQSKHCYVLGLRVRYWRSLWLKGRVLGPTLNFESSARDGEKRARVPLVTTSVQSYADFESDRLPAYDGGALS
jgi:hypothetical protein